MKLWPSVRCLVFLTHGVWGFRYIVQNWPLWRLVFAQCYVFIVVHANIRLALHRQSNYEKFFNYLSINTFYFVINKHTHLTALYLGLPGWAGTRKVKPISILLKQETVSGSGISWVICKSAPRSSKITTPGPHHSVFLQPGCPSCHPTNTVKALKACH